MASKAGYARGKARKIDTIASDSKTFAFCCEMAGSFARVQQRYAPVFEHGMEMRRNRLRQRRVDHFCSDSHACRQGEVDAVLARQTQKMTREQCFDHRLQSALANVADGETSPARCICRGGSDGHDRYGFERIQLRAAVAKDVRAACEDCVEYALR